MRPLGHPAPTCGNLKRITDMTRLTIILLAIIALTASLWADEEKTPQMLSSHSSAAAEKATPQDSIGSVAGLQWHIPEGWTLGPEKPMRFATYQIAAVEADSTKPECAVYYFGPGQGGDVEGNIKRWIGQMKEPEKVERSELETKLGKIALVDISGTYKESGGPMMATSALHPNWILLGAIVPSPQGSVFFKLTGPQATVTKVHELFIEMLKSATPTS